jgi:hypothetical protein
VRWTDRDPLERAALFAPYLEPGERPLSILLCSSRRSAWQWAGVNAVASFSPILGIPAMVGARVLNKWQVYYLCLTDLRLISMALSGFLEPLPNGMWAISRQSVVFLGITRWFLLNAMLHLRVNGVDQHYHVSWWRKPLLVPFAALGAQARMEPM